MKNPDIQVILTPGFTSEKKYIFDVLFEDYMGLNYSIKVDPATKNYHLKYGKNKVVIPDLFFDTFYESNELIEPEVSCVEVKFRNLQVSELPAWFLNNHVKPVSPSESEARFPADVIGMAFFLLTGYADIHFSKLDEHQRNSGKTAFVVRKSLIDRPIIQEWFNVIESVLFGGKKREGDSRIHEYSKHISHDVDQPFEYLFYTKFRLIKRLFGDLILRRNLKIAKNRLEKYLKVTSGNYNEDPYNNFAELLSLYKKENIKSTFFFVSAKDKCKNDVLYDIEHSAITSIIKDIFETGHSIGIHPSYNTHHNADLIQWEIQKLKETCQSVGVDIQIDKSRKHYLRWDWQTTPDNLDDAGIKDDYTVGYADRTGYRTGVAFPYRGFSWDKKEPLDIKLHPLIVMEASLLSDKYMGSSLQEAEKKIVYYHNQLSQIGGEFVLLWHNHMLLDNKLNLFKTFLRL